MVLNNKFFILVLVLLVVFTRYILQKENATAPKIVMVGPGYGLELNEGRVLTALHVAVKLEYPIIYGNGQKDIAIIFTKHKNKYDLKFKKSSEDFLLIDNIPKQGESGAPYINNNTVYGVVLGESNEKGLVAAFDKYIIDILNER